MGLFRRRRKAGYSGASMFVDALGFSGVFARSKNGVYAIGWNQESGAFVLCKNGEVVSSGKAPSPEQGAVSDAGSFALCLSRQSKSYPAAICFFDKDGAAVPTVNLPANVYALSFSRSGELLACQLLDGEISLVRASDGSILWHVPTDPTSNLRQLTNRLDVDEEKGWIVGRLEGAGTRFRISFEGEHLDLRAIQSDLLTSARRSSNGLSLFYIARERLDKAKGGLLQAEAEELLGLFDEALGIGFKHYPEYEAKAHRGAGEALEAMGRLREALNRYELALRKDPKVGIQRRAEALGKKLKTKT